MTPEEYAERQMAERSHADLLEIAVVGSEAEDFINSHPIGQLIVDKAKRSLTAAQATLIEIDPSDREGIAKAQLDARVANRVRQWLADAINEGRSAAASLQQERDQNGR